MYVNYRYIYILYAFMIATPTGLEKAKLVKG